MTTTSGFGSALAAVSLALALACAGDGHAASPTEPNTPSLLVMAEGDLQVQKPSSPLRRPLIVELRDDQNNVVPLAGVTVSWTATAGGGSVPATTTTDASGRTTAEWILGAEEGVQRVQADAGLRGPVLFHAVAVGPPREIVFQSNRESFGSGHDLFMMNPDGSDVVRLTLTRLGGYSPAWSPDGNRIAYLRVTSISCATAHADIVIFDFESLTESALTHNDGCSSIGSVDWSPDGTKLTFDMDGNIYVINTDGSEMTRLTHLRDEEKRKGEAGARWSPDGSVIVFTRALADQNRELWLINPDGTGERQLTHRPSWSHRGPRWSPDGTTIAVMRKVFMTQEDINLWLLNADGSDIRRVAGTEGFIPGAWSPDGLRFLASSLDGGEETEICEDLKLLDLTSGEILPLTDRCGIDTFPSWRPVVK